MRHSEFEHWLNQWLDGRHRGDLPGELSDHAAGCPRCAQTLAQLRQLDAALSTPFEVGVPTDFNCLAERIIALESARHHPIRAARPLVPKWIAASTAAAAGVTGVAFMDGPAVHFGLLSLVTAFALFILGIFPGFVPTYRPADPGLLPNVNVED